MNIQELRTKSEQELKDEAVKLRKSVSDLGIATLQKKEKNVKKARLLRKDLARVLTALNEKKILGKEGK